MKIILNTFVMLAIISCSALRENVKERNIASEDECTSPILAGPNCFRIGSQWSKVELKSLSDLKEISSEFHPVLKGTVQLMLGGSGVLLGKFEDKYVVASAAHICERNYKAACPLMPLRGAFRFLDVQYRASSIIGFWPEIDLILYSIEVDPKDEIKLIGAGANFDFSAQLDRNLSLAVSGYTLIHGFSGNLQMSYDSDCRILSNTNEVRLINDPDQLRPDKIKKWAFAMGCDVGPGDSGGPVINRETGAILGLVWTGNSSQKNSAKTSEGLTKIQHDNKSQLWNSVSYSSPAPKIAEYLKKSLLDPAVDSEKKMIIEAILNH